MVVTAPDKVTEVVPISGHHVMGPRMFTAVIPVSDKQLASVVLVWAWQTGSLNALECEA